MTNEKQEGKGELSLALEVMDRQPTHSPLVQVQQPPTTPMALLQFAMAHGGANLDQLERFMMMHREQEAHDARKLYVSDMAEFKKNPPTILKDKAVGYTNKDGTFTGYKHATLGNVTNAIVEGLAQHGFSHNWVVRQNNGMIEVDCAITHRAGHSEKVTMQATKDDSGKKNAIQQVASAITYLQRYTLLLATGLATHDQADDDGTSADLTTDTRVADEWIAKLAKCNTDAEVVELWQPALVALAKDKLGEKEFEDAFLARRKTLKVSPA